MRYGYFICDVFTDRLFGGNPLAVVVGGEGISSERMQQIALEFNFSETTFVLPSAAHTRRVRIFTPTREVPFAGHPNIGTAFVLASIGEVGLAHEGPQSRFEIVFEEEAGLVPISVHRKEPGRFECELRAPQPLSLGAALPPEAVANAVGLAADDIDPSVHPPQIAGVGLDFVVARVRSLEALARARPVLAGFEALEKAHPGPHDVHLYVPTPGDDESVDLRCRMFAPLDGVPEDPATGSANAALAALLAHHAQDSDAELRYCIAQGVEMGRPSRLAARAVKRSGAVTAVYIGGECVMFSRGEFELPPA